MAAQPRLTLDARLRENLSPAVPHADANSYLELVRHSSLLAGGGGASFARFLHRQRSLEVLLLWKEAELYRTLVSAGRASPIASSGSTASRAATGRSRCRQQLPQTWRHR
jgi:hypothetical protein